MIVTCEKCSTQFKLDDARVPERGVKVRCSRCKHAFHVERPPTGEHAIERAVEHALDGDTQELLDGDDTRPGGEDSPFDDSFDDSTDDTVEESDWEFNTDKAAPAHAPEPAPEPEPPPEPPPEPRPAIAEQSIEDLLGDPPAAGESLSGGDEFGETPELDSPSRPPPEPAPTGLGSPEDWNFFSDEPAGAGPAPVAKPAPGTAKITIGQLGIAPTAEREIASLESDRPPSWLGRWIGRGFHSIGWVIVLGLLSAVLARGVALSMPAAEAGPGVQALGPLEAREIEGRWLENAVAGPILVVSGELVSSGRSPSDQWIAVRLLDERGALVREDAAAVGPALSTLELREADPRELRVAQASAAFEMTRAAPGSRRRFHAVLHPVPLGAARFELVAVPKGERSPGAGPATSQPEG